MSDFFPPFVVGLNLHSKEDRSFFNKSQILKVFECKKACNVVLYFDSFYDSQ